MRPVGNFRRQFHAAIDRSWGEHQQAVFGSSDSVAVHPVEMSVLGNRRKERTSLSFKLDSEQIHAVDLRQDLVKVVGHFNTEPRDIVWNQCRRAADDDSRTKCDKAVNVRPRNSAVTNIADERDGQPGDPTTLPADRVDIEQPLRRMLMSSVACVQHSRLQVSSQ